MNVEDRVVERASQLLVERLLAKPKPVVDGDGDIHCPDCPNRVFVTKAAYRQHRTKTHHEPAYKARKESGGAT